MSKDLLKLADEAQAAADKLLSPVEAEAAGRELGRAVERLRDSLEELGAAVRGERRTAPPSGPSAPSAPRGSSERSDELAGAR
jgi:hypothetical protein